MRLVLLLLSCVALAWGFQMTNPFLPQKTTHRVRWMASTALRSVSRCNNREQCEGLNNVDPIWRNREQAVVTFQPVNDLVLIGFDQDDEDSTNEQHRSPGQQGWDKFTGVVVATGPAVSGLKEGVRVYFSQTCTQKWTAASWTAKYGPEKAISSVGRLMNGVSINNGNSWGSTDAPAVRTWQTPLAPNPSKGTEEAANGAAPIGFDDEFWYPGRAGAGWWPTRTPNQDVLRQDTPMENPGQQSNYLLCPQAQVFGVLSEESFAAVDTRHYIKSSIAFEQSKRQWTFADSSRYNGGVTFNNLLAARNTGNYGNI